MKTFFRVFVVVALCATVVVGVDVSPSQWPDHGIRWSAPEGVTDGWEDISGNPTVLASFEVELRDATTDALVASKKTIPYGLTEIRLQDILTDPPAKGTVLKARIRAISATGIPSEWAESGDTLTITEDPPKPPFGCEFFRFLAD